MVRPTPVSVHLIEEPERRAVPQTGATESTQRAEVLLPERLLAELWTPEHLERLARSYWRYLNRISLGLFRVLYEEDARTVVAGFRFLPLLRFHAPEYETSATGGTVTWRIDRGLLVGKDGRGGQGYLRIAVECQQGGAPPGQARLAVSVEVKNFYPWLRGSGWFARVGTWIYSQTQARIHVLVTNGFLRSLARLDLPPSRVGALRGEIAAGSLVAAGEGD